MHASITRLAFALLLAAGAARGWAQDPVFSQHTAAPVYANPALAGLFEGAARVSVLYRDQWAGPLGGEPLSTYAAAAELRQPLVGRDYLGLSAFALQDGGGFAGFTQTRFNAGAAVHKYLAGGRGRDATVASAALQLGYGQHRVDPRSLWYSSGLDTGSLVISRPGETTAGFPGRTRGYLDVNTGVNFSLVRRDYSLVVGLAAYHINQPNVSFVFDTRERLPARYQLFVAGEYLIQDELRVLPSATVQVQGVSRSATVGSALYYRASARGDAGLRAGTYARLSAQGETGVGIESIIVVGQLEYERATFGVSYDLNVGNVARATDMRGGYELSMSYVFEATRRGRTVVCPRF